MSVRTIGLFAASLATLFSAPARAEEPVFVVGSKLFTESVILGEMITRVAGESGADAEHRDELGGSQILFNALLAGEIDAYPEYTGTLRLELLGDQRLETDAQVAAALASLDVRMTWPLGFNNTYALGMTKARASELGVRTTSDLLDHPDARFGFSNEFLDRGDGWPALRAAYGLPQTSVRGLDHALAYRGLVAGDLDVIDLYSTDAEIAYYDLAVLEDDRAFFPRYDAVVLYRADVAVRMPAVSWAIDALAGTVPESAMVRMNERVKLGGVSEAEVVRQHLFDRGATEAEVALDDNAGRAGRVWVRTVEHLWLVGVSMAMAALVAIPLGVWAAMKPRAGQVILACVGIAQTIPSLALLVVLIRPLGLGDRPAIAALFVYALLPMVRSTQAGLASIPSSVRDSARAIGLGWFTRLRVIELPLAARSVLAGVKTSAVVTIGFATLGAWVGAGGYGKPILTGIRLDDFGLILEGAVPAAVMALAAQTVFELIERAVVPRGVR
ncbi:MAG: glycine betaine ABC transporter substrate-binding protein [Planctomycetota bacterium]